MAADQSAKGNEMLMLLPSSVGQVLIDKVFLGISVCVLVKLNFVLI